MDLRPYQHDIINEVRAHMARGVKRILIRSATGSGKTVLATHMLKSAAEKNIPCFFNVHRRELIKQSASAFNKSDLRYGITSAGFQPEYNELVQLCSIGSLPNRLHKLRSPGLILWDESHRLASKSWTDLFNKFPKAYHILLTATPERLDGKGLADYADVIVNGPEIKWLIDNKYLADYDYYRPGNIDMTGVKKEMGDYSKAHSVALVDKPAITGCAVAEYKKIAMGKRCLGFAITIEHSNHVVDSYKAAGIPAAHIDGSTPIYLRDQILKDFASGELKYVSNVGLCGEGFDLPSLDGVQMLRPSASLAWYLQVCGRALRADGDKVAFILDHVGNFNRHGMPCQERSWSLDGRAGRKKNGDRAMPVKICDKCYGAQYRGPTHCKYCGHEFTLTQREIEEIEGELSKVDKEKIMLENKKERGMAKTYDDLVKLGYSRGYKNPEKWAGIIHKSREVKRGRK